MTKCECDESRKNWRDDLRSLMARPKGNENGKSAAKPQIEVGSTTIQSYRSWNTDENKILFNSIRSE